MSVNGLDAAGAGDFSRRENQKKKPDFEERQVSEATTIPRLGLGTYGRTGEAGRAAIETAVEIGYRHLDTAQDYGTEANVGAVVRQSGLPRTAFFVTTKIAMGNLGAGKLIPSLERSLAASGLDRFDLTLIHWPSPGGEVSPSIYLPQLADAQAMGLTELIGVSNFTIALLRESIGVLGAGALSTNQIELHPYLQNKSLAAFCRDHGMLVTCYQPIAKGRLRGDPVLADIARSHGASIEQVALAFEMAKGYAAIPASGKRENLETNFAATGLKLNADDMSRIEAIDAGRRFIDPPWRPDWDE